MKKQKYQNCQLSVLTSCTVCLPAELLKGGIKGGKFWEANFFSGQVLIPF